MVTQVTTANFSNATLTALTSPTITSITVTNSSFVPTGETAVSLSGGYVTVVGSSFVSGATVYIDSTPATAVTFVNSTQLNVQVPGLASNSYIVYVINLDGSVAIRVNGINYSANPTWVTSGTQGFSSGTISLQLVASSDSTIIYTVASGSSLPSGLTLTSSGLLSGVVTGTGIVTYNFSVVATDVETQQSTQAFSITITFSDAYWNSVTLLLNGETPVTSFITDASTNNFNSTIAGDTRPTLVIPYQAGYYSNYFDGTGDYLTPPGSDVFAVGTGDFTIEYWVYALAGTNNYMFQVSDTVGGIKASAVNSLGMNLYTNGTVYIYANNTTYGPSANNRLPYYTWTHFAIVRSSSVTKLYINGQLETTLGTAGSITDTTNYTGTYPVIGVGYGSGFSWNGYISNFRIIKGTAVYTSNFTPSTSPLTAITNTSILTCQSNRLIDTSVNNFAITKNGDTTVTQFNPFGIPTSTTVNNRYSTYFDGTGDYLSVPYTSTLYFGSGDFTVEFWWYPPVTYTSTQGPCIGFGYKLSPQTGGWVIYRNTGSNTDKISIRLAIQGGFPGVVDFATASTPVANVWAHWAIVRIGTTLTWYKNGVVDATTTNSTNITDTDTTTLGYVGYAQQWGYLAQGNLSNVRIVKGIGVYTTAFTPPTSPLTATQSANVNGNPSAAISGSATSLLTCQDSTLIDNSTNVFPITSYGDARPIAVSPLTQTTTSVALTTLGSTYFDGTGDGLLTSVNAIPRGTENFTVELWLYKTTSWTASDMILVGPSPGLNNGFQFYINSAGASIYLSAWGVVAVLGYSTASLILNAWYHLVVTRSGNSFAMYLNGVSVATATSSQSFATPVTATTIGYDGSGSSFQGYLSNVRIIRGTGLYTSNFAPPVQSLTSVTNTQLLTLQYNGGANNSGIIDNSSFNNIITRFGNTSQGTFSPYSQTGWSTYFDGTVYPGFSLSFSTTPLNFALGQDFTVELWAYSITTLADYQLVNYGTYKNAWLSEGVIWITNKIGAIFISGGSGTAATQYTSTFPGSVSLPLNQWNHIALVRYNNNLTVYLNGVAGTTVSAPGAAQPGTNNPAQAGPLGLWFGVNSTNWPSFSPTLYTGFMSNFRYVVGTALYTNSFTTTIPTTPLTAITNTRVLTHQSNRLIDNGPLALAYTQNTSGSGSPIIRANSPFGGIPQATPISYSGYFDGTGDYLSVPTNAAFDFASGDFTVEAWIYLTTLTPAGGGSSNAITIITALPSSGTITGWGLDINNTNYVYWDNWVSGTEQTISATNNPITINTWYHVAVSRQSSTFRIFVNGNLCTTTGTVAQATNTGSNIIQVGAGPYTGYPNGLTGQISNLRVVKGVAVYTGAFTVPTSPLTATQSSGTNIAAITGVQTSLLTCQSTTFIDNSTNNFTITANGNTLPRTVNPFGYTTQTSIIYSPSVNGGSGYFDGTGDYLSIPANAVFGFGTGNFTWETWLNISAATNNEFEIWESQTTGSFVIYKPSSGASNAICYRAYGSADNIIVPTASIPYNQWFHLAVSRTSGVIKSFLNGVLTGTFSDATNFVTPTVVYTIGARNGGTNPMPAGYISDMRIVNGTALYTSNFVPPAAPLTTYSNTTPAVLLTNFTSGGVIDYHSGTVLETAGSSQLSTNVKQFGNASLTFDGSTSYLIAPPDPTGSFGSGNLTIECWVYFNNVSTNPQIIAQVTNGSSASNYSWQLYLSAASTLTGVIWSSSTSYAVNTTVAAGQWYFVALVRNSTTVSLYLNGISVGTPSTISANAMNWFSDSRFYAGRNSTAIQYFNGYLDELRVTKGIARYTSSPFAVPTTPFQTI
jgi:hypothetical protein